MSIAIFNHGAANTTGPKVIAVTGESALPTSAREGTLAVQCSGVGTLYIQRLQPATAADGAVWIVTGSASEIAVNLTLQGSLYVYPLRSYHREAGAWVSAALWGYTGGAWKRSRHTLFDYGVFGGDTYSESESQGTVTPETDNLHITLNGNAGANQALAVFGAVDFTGREKLHVRGDVISNRYILYVSDTISHYSPILSKVVTADGEAELDVSAITGRHYVLLGQGGGLVMEARIYEAYLL
ncbi:MAG: hypothetical protein LLF96_09880 [Eubacteriales bacterium]|nr:hypothetical protein [Eubacteriales bacterium]